MGYRLEELAGRRGEDICEIDERMAADGTVVDALDDEDLDARLTRFLGAGRFDAAAICLLHSYANPDHERRVADAVRRLAPGMAVTCSCDVSREFREYERASTTALAAFVQPVIEGYLDRFAGQLCRSNIQLSNTVL